MDERILMKPAFFRRERLYAYCSVCGKPLLQDQYNYRKHLRKCGCAKNNLSVRDNDSIEPLPEDACAYAAARKKGRLLFFAFTVHFVPGVRTNPDNIPSYRRMEWRQIYQASFSTDGTFREKGHADIGYWFSRICSGTLYCLNAADPVELVHAVFPASFSLTSFASFYRFFQSLQFPGGTCFSDEEEIPEAAKRRAGENRYFACVLPDSDNPSALRIYLRANLHAQQEFVRLRFLDGHLVSDQPVHLPSAAALTEDIVFWDSEDRARFAAANPGLLLENYKGRYPLLPLIARSLPTVLELLIKTGLEQFADRFFTNYLLDCLLPAKSVQDDNVMNDRSTDRYLYGPGTSLQGIFRVPLRILRKINDALVQDAGILYLPAVEVLGKLFREFPAFTEFPSYTPSYLRELTGYPYETAGGVRTSLYMEYRSFFCPDAKIGTPAEKAMFLRYLRFIQTFENRYDRPSDVMASYRRYLQYARLLERLPAGLFPKDVPRALEETVRLYRDTQDLIAWQQFRRAVSEPFYQSLATERDEADPDSPLHDSPYSVRIPGDPQDLTDEGEHMHNCVASYVSQVAQSQTCILFLRKRTSPGDSFVTLEVKKGSGLVQAKAFANGSVSRDVCRYLVLWAKTKSIRINTPDVRTPAA